MATVELLPASKPRKSSTRKFVERHAPYIPPTRGIPVDPNLDFTQSRIGVPMLLIYICRHTTKTNHFFVGSSYRAEDRILQKHYKNCTHRTPRSAFYKLLKADGVEAFSVEVVKYITGVFDRVQRNRFVKEQVDALEGVCLNEEFTPKTTRARTKSNQRKRRYQLQKIAAIASESQ